MSTEKEKTINFVDLVYGSTSEFKRELVRQIVEKGSRVQVRRTGMARPWTLEEIDAYCVFDDQGLVTCRSLVENPDKLTGQHLSRLAPLISFDFTAAARFLDNKENLQSALFSFLEQSPSWQKAVEAYVVSQCVKIL